MSEHDQHSTPHGGTGHDDAHGGAHDDHGGNGKYWMVFGALCVLTMMSFFTYSPYWPFHDTPMVGWVFMMAVSCTKASLVMLFFMHLLWEASWKYVLTIPATIMSFFLMLSLVGDVGQRTRYYEESRWLKAAEPVTPSAHHDGAAHDADHGHGEKGKHDHVDHAHDSKK